MAEGEPDHSCGIKVKSYEHAFARQALKDGRLMQYTKKHIRHILKQHKPEGARCRVTRRWGFTNSVGIITVRWAVPAVPSEEVK